ncbi:MAG: hypothetical protein P1P90_03590 [Patescibacteria group bacterium]|nr:hypothetical protein [Patescibacteria group bacterium]
MGRQKQKTYTKKIGAILSGVALLLSLFQPVLTANAQIPQTINYQSRLRTIGGVPITATTTIQFSLYNHISNGSSVDAPGSAGPLLWKETYDQASGACSSVQPDAQGYFFVQLGSCSAFPAYIEFDSPLYLGVKISADAEAAPRVLLASFPYALNSQRVNSLEATTTATGGQLLALENDLSFNIATGTYFGGGLTITGTSTLQNLTFAVATGTSLNLDEYLAIGAIRLDSTGTNNTTSGAYLVGVFDEFTNSNATTVQAALFDLDTAITAVSSSLFAIDLQQVTDNGATTTNRIQFAGATSTGDIIPGAHDTYSLGNTDLRWSNLWSGIVHVGTSTWDLTQAGNGAFTISQNGGSERMRIASNGNVGIGTNQPEQMLSVRDTVLIGQYEGITPPGGKNANLILRAIDGFSPGTQGSAYTTFQRNFSDIARIGINTLNSINFDNWDGLSWATRMMIDSTGKVGIGTILPSTLLHVQGGSNGSALLTLDSDDGSASGMDAGIVINSDNNNGSDAAYLIFKNNGVQSAKFLGGTSGSGFDLAGGTTFNITQSGFSRLHMTDSGNFGFATDTPAYVVDVLGDARLSAQLMLGRYAVLPGSGNQSGAVVYNTASSTVHYWDGTQWRTVATAEDVRSSLWDEDHDTGVQVEESADEDYIRFDTAGVERMFIQNDGKIGINTTGPLTAGLQIGQGGHMNAALSINGNPGDTGIVAFRDEDGEDIFTAMGSLANNDFTFMMGDIGGAYGNSYGGSTYIRLDQPTESYMFGRAPIKFMDASGGEHVGFLAPASITTSTIWTLPGSDGTLNGQALATNASGTLYWRNVDGAGSVWDVDGDTGIQVDNGTDNDQIELFAVGNKVAQFGNTPGNYSFEIYDNSGNRIIAPGIGYSNSGGGAETQNIGIGDLDAADNGTWFGVDTGDQKFGFNEGDVVFVSGKAGTSITEYRELVANGSNYVGFRAPASVANNVAWTLPGADGTNNQVLITNGAGTLSWATSSDLVYNIYNSDGLIPENRNVTIADGQELRFLDQGNSANFVYIKPDYNTNGNLRIGAVNNDEGNTNHYLEFMDNFKMVSQHGIELDASTSQIDMYGNTGLLRIGGDNLFMDLRAAGSQYGLRYAADYSADFVARSLVDKEYVDNKVASSTNNIYDADGYLAGDRIVNGIGRGLNVSTTNGGFFDADIRDGSDLGFVHVRSDELELNVANPSAYSGMVFNSGGVSFTHNQTGSTTQFYIGSNMMLTDSINYRGIEYASDYSANYTNRTLVDKEYVDDAITSSTVSAGNGLTLDSGTIKLGGTLSETTYIDHMGYDLVVREFAGEPETLFSGDNFKIQDGDYEVRFGIGGPTSVGLTLENPSSTFSLLTYNDYVGVNSSRTDFLGLVYDKDYSSYFVDRSLVDKGYVDSHVGALTFQDVADNTITADGYVYYETGAAATEDDGGAFKIEALPGGYEVEMAEAGGTKLNFKSANGLDPAAVVFYDARATTTGIEYGADYSADFTPRSLVDKAYVDNYLSASAGSGLTWDGVNNEIDLGGNLTQSTTINYGNFDFRIQNANNYQLFNNTNFANYYSDGVTHTNLLQNKDNIQFSGSAGFTGATYLADYSANYTNRSLVDKEYVDSAIVSATTTLNAAYSAGGSALGRQIFTLNNANPVEIINPGTDQWETSLALTNGVNGGGLAMQTMEQFGDYGSRLYFTDNTADPVNGTGAYMYNDNTMGAFEFGYQTAGTRNSSFYIDYSQMALNIPGSVTNGAFSINATNYNVPSMSLRVPGPSFSNQIRMSVGTSTPEAKVTGESGSIFFRTDGTGSSQQLYVKTTDAGNTGWFALAGADSNHWQKNTNVLSPTDSGVYQIAVTNNNASTLTGFKAVNTNDVSNYAGAVVEMKGSGADYTNNMYFGKYGAAFWIPTWAGNGVLATDKNLVLGAVGASSIIRYQIGGGYSAPITVATMDSNSMDFQSGVDVNVTSNVIVQGLTSSTRGLFVNATGTNLYATNQVMLGQHALNPVSGIRSGALVYNTASSTPFYWDGTEWIALGGSGASAGSLWDADHDTGIQVEQSPDEDIIRFDTAGTEYFTMQGPRISVLNSGSSVFLGQNAGRVDNLSNRQNVYVGNSAGYNNVTGLYNVSVGYEALYSHANPNNTTAIGYHAGRNYSGAFGGTMVGYKAGYQSTGNNNVMIGYESGMESGGTGNFFMGRGTGWYNTGDNNIMMGYYTGYDNKGSSNILFGLSAGLENKGNRGIFLGENAGRVNIGDDNIFLGYNSGRANATGTRNLFLGRDAGYNNVLGNGNIFLGYQAGYSETNSNRLYIDNSNTATPLVYGEFDTNVFRINGALQINNPSSTGYALPVVDGNSGQILVTNGDGNVAWASTSVLGTDTLQDVTDRGATTTNWIQFAGATSVGDIIPSVHNTYSLGNTDYRWSDLWSGIVHVGTSTWDLAQADNGAFTISESGNSEMMRITTDGYVGIGTEVPEELLSLNDDMLIGQFDGSIYPIGGYDRQLIIRATDGQLAGTQGTAYTTYQRDGVNYARVGLDTSNNINFGHYDGSWSNQVVISTSGNMGIGDTSPTRKIDVQGSATPGDNLFRIGGGANNGYLSVYMNPVDDRNSIIKVMRDLSLVSEGWGETMMHLSDNGLGIGTVDPAYDIDVVGDARLSAQLMLGQYALNPASGLQAGAMIYNTASSTPFFYNGSQWVSLAGSGSMWDTDHDTGIQVEESADEDIIRFDVAGNEAMKIDSTTGEPLVAINSPLGGYARVLQNINDEYDHFEIRAADVLNAFGGDLVFNFNPEEGFALYYASNQSSMSLGRQSFGVAVNNHQDAIRVDDNAFVGLSTSSPIYRLDVVGDARLSAQFMLGQYALNPASGLQAGAMIYNTASSTPFFWNGSAWKALEHEGSITLDEAYDAGGAGLGRQIIADSGAVRLSGAGNGTAFQIDYSGTNQGFAYNNSGAGEGITVAQSGTGLGMYIRQNNGRGFLLDNNTANDGMVIDTNAGGTGLQILNDGNSSNGLRIDNDTDGSGIYIEDTLGKASINISKPSGSGDLFHLTNNGTGDVFDMSNSSSGIVFRLANSGTGDTFYITDEALDTTPFVLTDDGDLGIGTATPDARLEIAGNNSLADVTLLKFQSTNNSDTQSEIYFSGGGNATNWNVNSSGNGGALIIKDGTAEVGKFLNNGFIINDGGLANVDFRVESDTNTHAMFVDATNGYVGFDQSVPLAKLHVGNTTAGSAADYEYMRLQGNGDVDHRLYIPIASNLMIWDYNVTGNGGAIEFRNGASRVGLFTNSGLVINDGGATGVGLRVEGDTNANLLYTSAVNDRVGIGTNAPLARFHVEQSGNVVAVFDRTTSDGTIISLRQAGVEEGTISVSANTVSYNAFTGSHYAWTNENIEKGMLVSLTGENRNLHNNVNSEILYGVTISTEVNDAKIMGSYLSLQEPGMARDEHNPHLIMAVGNGEVWVADKGENIGIGDYFISSDIAGHAQKDTGEFMVSHIVARAAESVDWTHVSTQVNGVKHKKISVFFESFDKNNIQDSVAGTSLQGGDDTLDAVDLVVANAVFEGNITVKGHVAFGKDVVGQAMIMTGDNRVTVDFAEDFGTLPIVTLTPAGKVTVPYWVENASLQGFDIVLDEVQYADILFNWHAFGNNEGRVYVSNGTTMDIIVNDMGASDLETEINALGQDPADSGMTTTTDEGVVDAVSETQPGTDSTENSTADSTIDTTTDEGADLTTDTSTDTTSDTTGETSADSDQTGEAEVVEEEVVVIEITPPKVENTEPDTETTIE